MKKLYSISLLTFIMMISFRCMDRSTKTNQDSENNSFPLTFKEYQEAEDPHIADQDEWTAVPRTLQASFGNTDVRYNKSLPPKLEKTKSWRGTAWKGERISAQIVLWASGNPGRISLQTNGLENSTGEKIDPENVKAHFVRYVLTDEFADGCGDRKKEDFEVHLAADVIDKVETLEMQTKTTRPVWVTIDVPSDTPTNEYKGKITITPEQGKALTLDIYLEVQDLVLPPASEWSYHLDLWQNPFAAARVHDVTLWSEEHFARMKPLMTMLAEAGQKCITTSIVHKPWDGQTQDHFNSMIDWKKKRDGSWEYDYTDFDRWVEFAHETGITEQINCYTMVPWEMSFRFYDEEQGRFDTLKALSGTQEYNDLWEPFLVDFARHLKSKNWFEKTTIAMDERPMEDMKHVINLVKSVDPEYKITLAGDYHEEIADEIYDLCLTSSINLPKEVMAKRSSDGKHTTYYTCCVEHYPNNFTFSPPAEGTWQAWHAANKGYNGYLRWAYNSWVNNPMIDSRFRSWPAGDTYLVYPDARSSIRFERIREGIQDFEKIRIIKARMEGKSNTLLMDSLNSHLRQFEISNLKNTSASDMVNTGKELINKISRKLYK